MIRMSVSGALLFAVATVSLSCDAAGVDSARILRDIPYYPESAYTNDYIGKYARLDLRIPQGASNFATVITFHGGGLVRGFRGDFYKASTADDVASVSAGYRLLTNATPAECVGDAAAAVAWTLRHIREYGGDPKKVFVSGYSGGGYLALMVGMDPKWLKPHGYRPKNLAGIVSSTGQASTHFTIRKMLGDDTSTYLTKVDEWAPLSYASRDLPPILLMTGESGLDIPCRPEENRLLYASLKALGHRDVACVSFPGRCHNDVWADHGPYKENFIRRLSGAYAGKVYDDCPNVATNMSLVGRDDWDSKFHLIRSSADGSEQPLYAVFPNTAKPVPLLVGFHTWSYSCRASWPAIGMRRFCEANGWAFLYPNCRGPNDHPASCGSELALADLRDAIAWAKTQCPIDEDRIYAMGGSGGGYFSLLAASRNPGLFAAVAAFCPITDLARWHRESFALEQGYDKMLERACGGKPALREAEYAMRSPLTHLVKMHDSPTAFYISTGIHDGHRTQSVPPGHSMRAFNALANAKDRFTEDEIAIVEAKETAPRGLAFKGKDPFYSEAQRIYLRRTSDRVRLTLFEGGHAGNEAGGYDFLKRQRRGAPPDWSLPEGKKAAVGAAEQITR